MSLPSDSYAQLLSKYIATSDESCLLEFSDLGKEMVHKNYPLDAVIEKQHAVLVQLTEHEPLHKVKAIHSAAAVALTELLISYEMAFLHLKEINQSQIDALKASAIELSTRNNELNALNLKLETLSRTDSLTGLHNRRALFSECEREWKRCLREKLPLTIIMGDIDHFKEFNDHYGHVHGDTCLRYVATAFADIAHRPSDIAARYGGEEFILLLPNTASKGAQLIAERLLESILNQKTKHLGSSVSKYVTISLGLATLIPSAKKSYMQLVQHADEGLYLAKQRGRNRAELSPMHHKHSIKATK